MLVNERWRRVLNCLSLILGGYLLLCGTVWIANRAFPLSPLQVADFVVNSQGDFILFSQFNHHVYVYSSAGRLKHRFGLRQAGGRPLLCLDILGNLYLARRRSVEVYDAAGTKLGVFTADLAAPENWKLRAPGEVVLVRKIGPGEGPPFETDRLRQIAQPGDLLFSLAPAAGLVWTTLSLTRTESDTSASRGFMESMATMQRERELPLSARRCTCDRSCCHGPGVMGSFSRSPPWQ